MIVGGNEATPHEYPWMAALYLTKSDGTYFCGGTLVRLDFCSGFKMKSIFSNQISDLWIMTAGHCIENALKVDIILGAHDLTNPLEVRIEKMLQDSFL